MTEDDSMIRRWATMNLPLQMTDRECYSDDTVADSSDHEQSECASRHREAILTVASKFADSWERPPRKRKAATGPPKVTKKPKSTPQPKPKPTPKAKILSQANPAPKIRTTSKSKSRNPPMPIVLGPDLRTSKVLAEIQSTPSQKQMVVHEPVKQFLQPTKMSRLNQSKATARSEDSSMEATKSAGTFEDIGSSQDAGNKHDETAAINTSSMVQILGCTAESPENSSVTPATENDTIEKVSTDINDYDDSLSDHDYSLSDHDFLDTDLSTLTNSTRTTAMSNDSPTPQTIQTGPTTRHATPSPPAAPITPSVPYSTTAKPFLRQILPTPISSEKYSPIPRLTLYLRVPTCFRIAEAIRLLRLSHISVPNTPQSVSSLGTHPSPSPALAKPSAIELFATITILSKTPSSTTVQFADLFFTHQAPYILGTLFGTRELETASTAVYRAIIRPLHSHEKPVLDAAAAQPHATCRVQVEFISPSSMQEVQYVRGIVDPEGVLAEKGKSRERERWDADA